MRRFAIILAVVCAAAGCKGKKKQAPAPVDAGVAGGADAGVTAQGTVQERIDRIVLAEDARAGKAVMPYLRDKESPVRARAARALGRIGDASTFDSLRALLEDPVREVRIEVAEAIAIAGDPKAGPELVKRFTLEKDDPFVVRALLRALGMTAGEEGLPVLTSALADSDALTRAEAALALSFYGVRKQPIGAERVHEVAKLLVDPDAPVRYAAAYALFRAKQVVVADAPAPTGATPSPPSPTQPPPPSPPLPQPPSPPPPPQVVPAALEAADLEALIAAAEKSGEPETSAIAVRALSVRKLLPIKLGADLLARGDLDWRVKVEVARGLAERDDKQLLAAVKELHNAIKRMAMDGASAHVAIAGIEALQSRAKVPGVVAEVKKLLDEVTDKPDATPPARRRLAHVRCAAAGVLAKGGQLNALAKCDPGLVLGTLPRRMLADALGADAATLKSAEVDVRIKALETLIADKEATVRAAAAGAAGQFADPRAQRMVREKLAEEDIGVATAAAEAVKAAAEEHKRPDPNALPRLLQIITDKKSADWIEPRLSAIDTVAVFPADAKIDEALRKVLTEGSAEIVRRARAALTKRGAPPDTDRPVAPDPPPHPQLASGAQISATITLGDGLGELKCTLDRDTAPRTVDSFVALARKKFYDGLTWHRVVPNFVTQGGDPRGDGTGGPGYLLRAEASLKPYARGALGIADAGKDTGGSQFFLMHSRAPHLEGRYTWFGQCDGGLDAMDMLFVGDKIEKIVVDVR